MVAVLPGRDSFGFVAHYDTICQKRRKMERKSTILAGAAPASRTFLEVRASWNSALPNGIDDGAAWASHCQ